jgi:hypothetical protein
MDASGSSCSTTNQKLVPLDEEPHHTFCHGQWAIASMSLLLPLV